MLKNININLSILILFLLFPAGCAWENIPEGNQEKPLRVRITMDVQGKIDANLFYFIVFNFSGDTKQMPKPDFEGDERGKYWDAYYMYGNPRLTGNDFYRGVAGKTKSGENRLDKRPIPSAYMNEFVSTSSPTPGGPPPSTSQIKLELDFGVVDMDKFKSINMNMMVSSLPFDRIDNPDDQYDAFVYDNFEDNGVTLPLSGGKTDFNEEEYKKETQENIGENPPPNANIIDWRLLIL